MTRSVEREIIIGATDADGVWHVYADIPSRFYRALLAVAQSWEAATRRSTSGIEAELPLRAIRLVRRRRLTEAEQAQRRRAAEAAQEARGRSRTHRAPIDADGSSVQVDAEAIPVPRLPSEDR